MSVILAEVAIGPLLILYSELRLIAGSISAPTTGASALLLLFIAGLEALIVAGAVILWVRPDTLTSGIARGSVEPQSTEARWAEVALVGGAGLYVFLHGAYSLAGFLRFSAMHRFGTGGTDIVYRTDTSLYVVYLAIGLAALVYALRRSRACESAG